MDIHARALLDQGSELSFVRESVVQTLNLPRQRASVPVVGIGSWSAGSTRGVISLRLRSCSNPSFVCGVAAYVLPRLTGRIPTATITTKSWKHLDSLSLADPEFARPDRVDIILGADVYGSLLRPSIRTGTAGQAVAQNTALGWIVFGPTDAPSPRSSPGAPLTRKSFAGALDLNELLYQFWAQEEAVPINPLTLTAEEADCEAHFASTHTRTPARRYVVRLPFRSGAPELGDSRFTASRMLRRMQCRFNSDGEFSRLYIEFMEEYETLGHMARVSAAQLHSSGIYFLPHHGVFRSNSTTSRLRVVFNGSARTSLGAFLNDCLHVGPKLQRDLADVLLRWRKHAYVFLADIEKMYRQVEVHPDDRDFQRVLWPHAESPHDFQLCTVTYGLSCAPYLALRILQQLAVDEGARFPGAADILRTDMYVDDVPSGGDTLELARSRASQVDRLLTAGGYHLHKWMSNHNDILEDVVAGSQMQSFSRAFHPETFTRALGLTWVPSTYVFLFQFHRADPPDVWTKRAILSRISQLFDPLGWVTPVTIVAKILIQSLWRVKVGWDDALPSSIAQRWVRFEKEFTSAATFSIPRWLGSGPSVEMEIHGFADASQDAYGAVLYLRVLARGEAVHVSLLTGKSRVAPLKKMTIPRLELSAAVLLVQLLHRAQGVLESRSAPIHLWTDSSVALAWINGHPSRWKEFVANRVTVIRELAPHAHWRHVAGVDNPADCASRGLSPLDFAEHRLW